MNRILTEDVCASSWKYFKEHLQVLLPMSALLVVTSGAGGIFFIKVLEGEKSGILPLVLFLSVSILLQLGLLKMTLNISGNKPAVLKDAFKSHNMSLRYLVGCIAYAVVVLVGLCLFIVPGVVWAVRYSLWPFFLVHRDMEIVEAFKESKRITHGSKRDLGVLYLALFGGIVLSFIPFGLGLFFAYPYALLVTAHAYRKVQLLRTSEALYANATLKAGLKLTF